MHTRVMPLSHRAFRIATLALTMGGGLSTALANDSACRAVLEKRVQACAQACVERAKAAVAPEVRDRILGYGCTNNCAKLEMFNGHTCPS